MTDIYTNDRLRNIPAYAGKATNVQNQTLWD